MTEVRDNPKHHRFELALEGGTAFIDYRRHGTVVTMTHAEVPKALEGKGVGSKLVRGALAIIRANGDKIVPQCSFVDWFVRNNAEYRDLVKT